MNDPVIVDALRTPIGRYRGGLSGVRADDLAGHVIREICMRVGVPKQEIDDVIFGCANQAGEDNRNVARMALLLGGLPQSVPGVTVNRLCGSGLEAILQAARAIRAGEGKLYLAGGVESMSRAPFALPKSPTGWPNGNLTAYDTSLGWRFPNDRMKELFPLEAMGETAENVAEKYKISREAQDRFALSSHEKATQAEFAHTFADERIEIPRPQTKEAALGKDEGPRADSSLEKLASLKPAFRTGGTVTAGNSSTLNDGAAVTIVCSAEYAKKRAWVPLARVVGGASAGVDPRFMGIGPVPATRKLFERIGWKVQDLDLIELNEAFAAQSLAVIGELGLDETRVNVNGGAIALGHPLGSSGARIVGTLLHEMRRRSVRRGLATMCIGVGQGISAAFEAI